MNGPSIRSVAVAAAVVAILMQLASPTMSMERAVASPAIPAVAAIPTEKPLIILMDTSGSMEETVPSTTGNGNVKKLDAAKVALQAPIRNQPPGSSTGIWTYPGDGTVTDGCGAGGWLVDIDSTQSSSTVLEKIASLAAVGDTPTGPALTSAVDNLKARGIHGASIVIVSDGLYTCGTDPCEVAKGLAGTGFDVSIQAVGFDISDDGRSSLQCMADATGGKYFDAADSDELAEVINELTAQNLTITIANDPAPVAGVRTPIRVTVKNTSARDVHTIDVTLAFTSVLPRSTSARVLPPTIPIGTLPAGKSATRSWVIVPDRTTYATTSTFSISARSLETRPVQVTGSFTTTIGGSEAADAGPILSDLLGSDRSLVILGDSFSSGQGTYSYLPATDTVSQDCHRSPDTYLARTFTQAKVRVEVLACSGAITNDLQAPQGLQADGSYLAPPQLEQLTSLQSTPGAAVMTLGGNDIGFSEIVGACVRPNSYCGGDEYTTKTLAIPAKKKDLLVDSYKAAWRALNTPDYVAERGGDFAPLIVLGYPQAVHDTKKLGACPNIVVAYGIFTGGFNAAETRFAEELVTTLNSTVKSAVAQARADGIEVYFVDNTEGTFLPDHTACAGEGERWVNRVDLVGKIEKPESVHPNKEGYSALTGAVIQWSKTVKTVPPAAAAKASTRLADAKLDGYLTADYTPAPVQFTAVTEPQTTPTVLRTQTTTHHLGDALLIDVPGMGTSPVTAALHSDPTLLTTLVPDEDGRVRGAVVIPEGAALGSHELVLTGWDEDGTMIVKTTGLAITPRTPIWVWGVGILAAALVLGAGALAFILRRRTRTQKATG
jgi:hypothetical protein